MLAICSCIIVATTVANAQARFDWPKAEPDISKYTKIEQCLSVSEGLTAVARYAIPRQDTIPLNAGDTMNSVPDHVVAEIQRCAANFSVQDILKQDTVYPNDVMNAYTLFLLAHRENDAKTLSEQWLNSLESQSDSLKALSLATFARISLRLRPVRLPDAWSFINAIDMRGFWRLRMTTASRFLSESIRIHDKTRADEAAEWITRTPEILGPEITSGNVWQNPLLGFGQLVLSAHKYLRKNDILDSLKHSTESYYALLQQLQDRSKLNWRTERIIPSALEGEYWFPKKPADPRPRRGVVSVIMTTGLNDCFDCLGRTSMIRRLHDKFPNVEFTMLARTRGYYGLVIEPPTPEEEAMLIDSVYRKLHQLPATIVVYKTPFWKLPDPDRRRVNEPGPNERVFPTLSVLGSDRIYLIDRNGELIYTGNWTNREEAKIMDMLAALVQQP